MEDWIFFKDINFADQSIRQYHVDTRDFHVNQYCEVIQDIKIPDLSKYGKQFLYSAEEVANLLERYFKDSGGIKDWRFFMLEPLKHHEGFGDWILKYIRIYRMPSGELIVCNSKNYALNKETTSQPVKLDKYGE